MKVIQTKKGKAYINSLYAQPFLPMPSEAIKCLEGNELSAIQLFCLECAYSPEEVASCDSYYCPFWDFRPYKKEPQRPEDTLVPTLLDLVYIKDPSKVQTQKRKAQAEEDSFYYFWWQNPSYTNKTLRGDTSSAIHLKCSNCMESYKDIVNCNNHGCTLWEFRPQEGTSVRPPGFLPDKEHLLRLKDKHPAFSKPVFRRARISKKRGVISYYESFIVDGVNKHNIDEGENG